jgi:poly(3-hydroxybutyrate) depolymerase
MISCNKDDSTEDRLLWEYGRNDYNEIMDDTLRNFLIHVPDSYAGDTAVPLVFMLHGSSGSGTKFYNISGWVEKSNEEGFIVVFPTGLEYPIVEKDNKLSTKWSSDGLVVDIPEGYPIKDDVPFIRELVEKCKSTFNIDKKKAYITGFSNGGGFVRSRALFELNDVFAACNFSGGYGLPETATINGRIMPAFAIIGSKDDRIISNSGVLEEIPLQMKNFYDHDLYGLWLKNVLNTLELEHDYTEEPNPPAYNLVTFNKSVSQSDNEYKLMIINDMGHNYANGTNNPNNVKAADHLWSWFSQYSL